MGSLSKRRGRRRWRRKSALTFRAASTSSLLRCHNSRTRCSQMACSLSRYNNNRKNSIVTCHKTLNLSSSPGREMTSNTQAPSSSSSSIRVTINKWLKIIHKVNKTCQICKTQCLAPPPCPQPRSHNHLRKPGTPKPIKVSHSRTLIQWHRGCMMSDPLASSHRSSTPSNIRAMEAKDPLSTSNRGSICEGGWVMLGWWS